MEETQAFGLLRHLMFRRGLRAQYLPDMVGLQVRLYQLSRLLHDQMPDLYRHLDEHEVAPTLYAAPWILTVFASQFPLGFVTRVFGRWRPTLLVWATPSFPSFQTWCFSKGRMWCSGWRLRCSATTRSAFWPAPASRRSWRTSRAICQASTSRCWIS